MRLWELVNSEKLLEHKGSGPSMSATQSFVRPKLSGQWLQIQDLDLVSPDQERFTDFSFEMKKAMKLETENFFAYCARTGDWRFLTADYTFANKMLADFYELEGDFGEGFESFPCSELSATKGRTSDAYSILVTGIRITSPVKRALGVG